MNIRPATLTDAPCISALILSLNAFVTISGTGAGAEKYIASVSEAAVRGYIAAENMLYFVAEVAGADAGAGPELAGVVAVRDNKHLFHLFIAAKHHRTGLGRKLWNRVREAAQANGNSSGFTVNASLSAISVYERWGFRAAGVKVLADGVAFLPMALRFYRFTWRPIKKKRIWSRRNRVPSSIKR
jgi:GNAT superfamily N-acetyltransferase